MPDTTPTAADLRWSADRKWYDNHPGLRAALRAGAAAMDERDRLREEYNSARSLLDTIADAPLKLDLARQTIDRLRADRAALAAALRRCSEVLTVPAAEYVPAISDAWAVIDAALAEHGSGAE